MKRMRPCIVIILIITLCTLCIIPVTGEQTEISDSELFLRQKTDENTWNRLNLLNNIDTLDYWVWFTDVDISEVNSKIQLVTGVSEKEILQICTKNKKDSFNAKSYKTINDYQQERKRIYSELYTQSNNNTLNKLGISDDKVVFFSKLTPSAILKLSKSEVIEIAQSKLVTYISINETDELPDPTEEQTIEKQAMHYDVAQTYGDFNVTGNGINTLIIGGYGLCWYDNPNEIPYSNPESVYNAYGNQCYPITDRTHVPPYCDNHATHVVNIFKQYAPDSVCYVVRKDVYQDIEWTIINKDVHLINASIRYPLENANIPKWYDVISKNYNLPLVASAGNTPDSYDDYTYHVISPACGYNSIAVGAYYTYSNHSQDNMRDYRYYDASYNTNDYYPCYKPEVVIAANDTSSAAPALSGIIACALEKENGLIYQPETIKAIVMASCHRKVLSFTGAQDETMVAGLTQKQGAGAVDAYRLLQIADSGTFGWAELSTSSSVFETDLVLNGNNPLYQGSLQFNDNLNVSLAWMVSGSTLGQYPDAGVTINTKHDLSLKVYHNNNTVGSCEYRNCGKQMVYLTACPANSTYSIEVKAIPPTEGTYPTESGAFQKIGYAWSEKGVSELTSVEIDGIPAVGQSLHAIVTDSNSVNPADTNNYTYQWQRSTDGGLNWSTDIGNSNQYVITNDDFGSLIRCNVKPLDCSLYSSSSVSSVTPSEVFIYGDVNLDGHITDDDATLIQRYLVGLTTLNNVQKSAADVNLNGIVDIIDATLILQYLYNIVQSLPVV